MKDKAAGVALGEKPSVALWLIPALCVPPVALAAFVLRVFPVMFEDAGFAYPPFTTSVERYRFAILCLSLVLAIAPMLFARGHGLSVGRKRFFVISLLLAAGLAGACLVALALPILGLASVSHAH